MKRGKTKKQNLKAEALAFLKQTQKYSGPSIITKLDENPKQLNQLILNIENYKILFEENLKDKPLDIKKFKFQILFQNNEKNWIHPDQINFGF